MPRNFNTGDSQCEGGDASPTTSSLHRTSLSRLSPDPCARRSKELWHREQLSKWPDHFTYRSRKVIDLMPSWRHDTPRPKLKESLSKPRQHNWTNIYGSREPSFFSVLRLLSCFLLFMSFVFEMHLISVRSAVVQRVHILNTSRAYSLHCISTRSILSAIQISQEFLITSRVDDCAVLLLIIGFGATGCSSPLFSYFEAPFSLFSSLSHFSWGERVVHWSRSQGIRNVWSLECFRCWNSWWGKTRSQIRELQSHWSCDKNKA